MTAYAWRVEATVPSVWRNKVSGEERPVTKNLSLQVIASTLDEAVDAVKIRHRDVTVTFLKVWRERHVDDVILAGEAT